MSHHFPAPMTVQQIAERGTSMMDEATATLRLASEMAEFERVTGRKVILSEAAQPGADPGLVAVEWIRGTPTEPGTVEPDAELVDALHPAPVPSVEVQDITQGPQDQPETGKSASPAIAEPVTEDGPSAVSTEPLRAMPEPTRTMNWAGLTLPERRIVKHLERLPDTFAPQDDLCLVEMLTSGNKIDLVAEFLGVARSDALDRWKSMLTDDVVGADGRPSLDGQKRLLAALRYRVEAA